jgi:two-component system chemotaxis response regulator CheY
MSAKSDDFSMVEDFFRELGSIGSGCASTAFSEIMDKNFIVEIKEVQFDRQHIVSQFLDNKKSDDLIMVSNLKGFLEGIIILNSNKNSCKRKLISSLVEYSSAKNHNINESDRTFYEFIEINGFEDVFYEIFNIGISYYLSAVSNLLNEKISISETEYNKEDSKLLKSVLNNINDYMCVETTVLYRDTRELAGTYLFVVSKASLDKVIRRFQTNTILICDDTSFMRVVFKEIILKKYPNVIIEEAKDGNDAFEKYKQCKPDLVIMDMVMPECNGINATENILKYDPNAKIIIASATAVQLEVIRAISAGAKDFISKPYDPKRVLDTVKKFLFETTGVVCSSR